MFPSRKTHETCSRYYWIQTQRAPHKLVQLDRFAFRQHWNVSDVRKKVTQELKCAEVMQSSQQELRNHNAWNSCEYREDSLCFSVRSGNGPGEEKHPAMRTLKVGKRISRLSQSSLEMPCSGRQKSGLRALRGLANRRRWLV